LKNKLFTLKNFKVDHENVWIGKTIHKFYHHKRCPKCNSPTQGYNDLNSTGPWQFSCTKCDNQWEVILDTIDLIKRKNLLNLFKEIDELAEKAKDLNRRFKTL